MLHLVFVIIPKAYGYALTHCGLCKVEGYYLLMSLEFRSTRTSSLSSHIYRHHTITHRSRNSGSERVM